MLSTRNHKLNLDKKFFLLIFTIAFTVFIFTSDAHRYTIDEHHAQQQTLRLATLEPDPAYIQGVSKQQFHMPIQNPYNEGPLCKSGLICYPANVVHSLTQVPFVFINHNLHIFTDDTVIWENTDFNDAHYVYWRNGLDPDFTFLEFFYGPIFSALSVGVFFLICRTFSYKYSTSIMLSLFYAFSTTVWAYSNTSLNVVPVTFFVLLGFWFFRKFQKNQSNINLALCGIVLSFGFLVRQDAVLFIIPIFFLLLYDLIKKNTKAKNFISFVIPTVLSYVLHRAIILLRSEPTTSVVGDLNAEGYSIVRGFLPGVYFPIHDLITRSFGMLLSPGVGLLIFSPILLTIFFQENKNSIETLSWSSF